MHIPKDRMTPKERMAAFAGGKPVDRVPCLPIIGQTGAHFFGNTSKEFNLQPKVMARVLGGIFEAARPDNLNVGAGLQGLPDALGCTLSFPDAGAPIITAPGFTEYSEVAGMSPADPEKDGRLPGCLEVLEAMQKKYGDEVFVSASIGGPFTSAALFTGTERFLKDMVRRPEDAHAVLELMLQSLKNTADAVFSRGGSLSVSEPIASNTIISRARFQTFAQPYLKRLTDYVREKYKRTMSIHICGRTKPIWLDIADAGFTSFSVDNVERISEVAAAIGDRVAVIGNVPPVEVLLKGTGDDVFAASRQCIAEGKGSPKGYALGSGCEIPPGVPLENLKALVDAARIYGANKDFA